MELDGLKVEYLGKKGSITALLKTMGKLSVKEKKSFGSEVNALKEYATIAIAAKAEQPIPPGICRIPVLCSGG